MNLFQGNIFHFLFTFAPWLRHGGGGGHREFVVGTRTLGPCSYTHNPFKHVRRYVATEDYLLSVGGMRLCLIPQDPH